MASLKVIKKRIGSVRSTQKITRAMKLVSAAKLRRATDKVHASRPFEKELLKIVSGILNEVEWTSELTQERPVKKVALVVLSTDRGLCGSLNTNNFKAVMRRISELGSTPVEIIALGKRANDFFKRRGFTVRASYIDMARNSSAQQIAEISTMLRNEFLSKAFDRVEIFYSRFQSALVQQPTGITLLPFTPQKGEGQKSFLMEPGAFELLDSLVPMLIDFQLYRVVLESIASEHGARMSAMESATKNAREMIDKLTLERNRTRQAAITKELLEIISGAEALSA